jgi:hypothetical protein
MVHDNIIISAMKITDLLINFTYLDPRLILVYSLYVLNVLVINNCRAFIFEPADIAWPGMRRLIFRRPHTENPQGTHSDYFVPEYDPWTL